MLIYADGELAVIEYMIFIEINDQLIVKNNALSRSLKMMLGNLCKLYILAGSELWQERLT